MGEAEAVVVADNMVQVVTQAEVEVVKVGKVVVVVLVRAMGEEGVVVEHMVGAWGVEMDLL